jgi:hypothetical protein
MRFAYLNANSMRAPKLDKWKAYLDDMQEVQIDVLGLNETCINMNLIDTRQQFQNILTKKFRNSSMSISTTKTKHKRAYLPGGTMVTTVGKWNSKICGQIFDVHHMGRWSGTSYQVTNDKKLHIITAYRV